MDLPLVLLGGLLRRSLDRQHARVRAAGDQRRQPRCRGRRIAITSSQGPTRDGREKPDVAAPGSDIVAAKGFSGPSDAWIAMSGTSMASPVHRRSRRPHARRRPEPHCRSDRRHPPPHGPSASRCRLSVARRRRSGRGRPGSLHRRGRVGPREHRAPMKIRVFQAGKGDCLLLTGNDGTRILVDGGMRADYRTTRGARARAHS